LTITNPHAKIISSDQIGNMGFRPNLYQIHQHLLKNDQAKQDLSVLGMERPINVDKIYVETKLVADSSIQTDNMLNNGKILGINAIKENRKVIVRGKPGSGKSTFLRHIYSGNICSEIAHLPILVSLKDFSHAIRPQDGLASCLGLDTYIKDTLGRSGIEIPDLEQVFTEGMALFLLDGVDEMAATDIDRVVNFVTTYESNRFVISCRNAATPMRLKQFIEVEIADFDPKQAIEFINNFCREAPHLFEDPMRSEDFAKGVGKLRYLIGQRVGTTPADVDNNRWREKERWVEKFSQTPLLLTMLIPLVIKENEIPTGRLDLYDKSIDLMLTNWDRHRDVSRRFPSWFTPQERKHFLSHVALKAHEQNLSKISTSQILSIVRPPYQEAKVLEDILQMIEESSGILLADKDCSGLYTFRHKTFQEYFTANKISSLIRESDLKTYINKDRIGEHIWLEVFSLVAESLSKHSSDQALIDNFFNEIIEGIRFILVENPSLNKFVERVNHHVTALLEQESKTLADSNHERLIAAALRVFFFDPDYSLDPTRTLLLELDNGLGNVLVASSFVIRLFCDQSGSDIEILEAIETVRQVPMVDRALNADDALKIMYEYVRKNNYRINRTSPRTGYLKIREHKIETELIEIYSKDTTNLEEQARRCRRLCHKYLKLDIKYNLRSEVFQSHTENNIKVLEKFYTSTLLLTKTMNIISETSRRVRNEDIINSIMMSSFQIR
jgi:hypothetical protein